MADANGIESPATPTDKEVSPHHYVEEPAVDYHGDPPRPSGWMYKSLKIGPIRLPWYASPSVQLTMVSFVCFMCPGMFNALSGLGGGGKQDPTTADNMVNISPAFQVVAFTLTDCS